jgi:hypothetical protein
MAETVASTPCICERNEHGCVKWKIECEACAAGCDDPHPAKPSDAFDRGVAVGFAKTFGQGPIIEVDAAKPLNADIQKVITDLAVDHHYCCPHRPGAGMGGHNNSFCTACVEKACRRVVAKRDELIASLSTDVRVAGERFQVEAERAGRFEREVAELRAQKVEDDKQLAFLFEQAKEASERVVALEAALAKRIDECPCESLEQPDECVLCKADRAMLGGKEGGE